jgi:hypothetical protein
MRWYSGNFLLKNKGDAAASRNETGHNDGKAAGKQAGKAFFLSGILGFSPNKEKILAPPYHYSAASPGRFDRIYRKHGTVAAYLHSVLVVERHD